MPQAPPLHRAFLERAVALLAQDARLVGVAAGGSFRDGAMDEWSDLDLVVAVEPADYETVLASRVELAGTLGPLLAAFTGEHVGEPRVLICLYGPPALHVDLKFVSLDDAAQRVEDPVVLWERDGRLTRAMGAGAARYPSPDLQWIEDRFWVWVHYGAAKIGRGELWEVLDFLAFLRSRVLGPLASMARGARAAGVRKLERVAPELVSDLRGTVATHDRDSCLGALAATAELYVKLRAQLTNEGFGDGFVRRADAERVALAYLSELRESAQTRPEAG